MIKPEFLLNNHKIYKVSGKNKVINGYMINSSVSFARLILQGR